VDENREAQRSEWRSTTTEKPPIRLYRAGQMDQSAGVHQEITQRNQGGHRTHQPEVVEYVEERGWDVDFYLLCAYNRVRTRKKFAAAGRAARAGGEVYLETDPPHAYQRRGNFQDLFPVQSPRRRARAGSPEDVDKAFKLAFDSIKPKAASWWAMFPRFKDEVKENCGSRPADSELKRNAAILAAPAPTGSPTSGVSTFRSKGTKRPRGRGSSSGHGPCS